MFPGGGGGTLAETRGSGGGSQCHAVRGLVVGMSETDTIGSVCSDRDWKGKGVRLMYNVQMYRGTHGNVVWWGDWVYTTSIGVGADNYIMGT